MQSPTNTFEETSLRQNYDRSRAKVCVFAFKTPRLRSHGATYLPAREESPVTCNRIVCVGCCPNKEKVPSSGSDTTTEFPVIAFQRSRREAGLQVHFIHQKSSKRTASSGASSRNDPASASGDNLGKSVHTRTTFRFQADNH